MRLCRFGCKDSDSFRQFSTVGLLSIFARTNESRILSAKFGRAAEIPKKSGSSDRSVRRVPFDGVIPPHTGAMPLPKSGTTLTSSTSTECSTSTSCCVQPGLQRLCKALKAQVQTLGRALLDVQDVVDRHGVRPCVHPASEVELGQPRDDTDEDLLRGVFGILLVPEDPQGEVVDAALQFADNEIKRTSIAVDRQSREIFQ